jgi:hypothetical protein
MVSFVAERFDTSQIGFGFNCILSPYSHDTFVKIHRPDSRISIKNSNPRTWDSYKSNQRP